MIDPSLIAGMVLAGGRSTRMGGADKALVTLDGTSLVERAIERLRPQLGRMMLNANGDPGPYRRFGLPILPDPVGDRWGPLAGILAGLEHLAAHWPHIAWLASVPTDCPFFPEDLVARLADAAEGSEVAMAVGADRLQPVFALWHVTLAEPLRRALFDGQRKVDRFAESRRLTRVEWPGETFFNINSPEDLLRASRLLGRI